MSHGCRVTGVQQAVVPTRCRKPRILVVDDDRVLASTLATILAAEGYQTATSFSGEGAIQVARSFEPDFIVSDIMMGTMNGVQAAMEILRFLPGCKVLFVSGDANYADALTEPGVQRFRFEVLAKPIDPLDLLTRISQVLPAGGAEIEESRPA